MELSYQELAKKTGLSISYLSEIEKGKKYPKGDKILSLAAALDVDYDYLVSLKVSKRLEPLVNLINSDFLKEFPLELYGLDPQKVLQILSDAPEKVNAFVNSILQIARNYELSKEDFYSASLRSYQELNDNYLKEVEDAAAKLREEYSLTNLPIKRQDLLEILEEYFQVNVDFTELGNNPTLKNIRSYHKASKNLLLINSGLSEGQINFLLARELAFNYLELKNRPHETPPQSKYSFEFLLNNFKASYFSAALLIDEKLLKLDIQRFARLEKWDSSFLIGLLDKYNCTPEMLMQRLTNLLPKFFNIKNLFFLRFIGDLKNDNYQLTKELHINKVHNPHSNELNEHYCRRWLTLRVMKELEHSSAPIVSGAQISQYWQTKDEYLILSLALPNVSDNSEVISISIGFYIDKNLRKNMKFLKDSTLPKVTVHTTCERCNIKDCQDRKASPEIFQREQQRHQILEGLKNI